MAGKKATWQLTPMALEKFLRRIDASPGRAEERYKELHQRLVRYFEWQGCHIPEESADETLDRAIRKVEEGANVPDVPRFVSGIARNVLKEYWKFKPREVSLDAVPEPPHARPDENDETLVRCIEGCLHKLPGTGRMLLLAYHGGEDRLALANRNAMSLNALRLRVFHLKDRLKQCAKQCVADSSPRPFLVS
jgi:DNA-directed RNA polymerase specialized sigma24 family protein